MAEICIVGSTGFMGQALTRKLLQRGHRVLAVARAGSERKAVSGAEVISADPLNHESYLSHLNSCQTLVQLAGVSHPNPFKSDQFKNIDFVCGRESVLAVKKAGIKNFVYVSVAQPAPIMKKYIEARVGVEKLIQEASLNATILRPWYVIGPARRWPLIIQPIYWILENQSATRATALRFGFVTIDQMVAALVRAIEYPAESIRIWEVPDIRSIAS